MAPPKRMSLKDFLDDENFGGSWADEDIDMSSISVPIESHRHYDPFDGPKIHRVAGDNGAPYIVKLLNLPVTSDDGFVQDLFRSRYTTYVKFKIVIDPSSSPLVSHIIKKVAFVELLNYADLSKVLKWQDLYYKGNRRVIVEPADFLDFQHCIQFNQEHALELDQVLDDFISGKVQERYPPRRLPGMPLPENRTGQHLTPQAMEPIRPKPRLNPFGNAKPVDIFSKEKDLESKITQINHTTIRTLGSNTQPIQLKPPTTVAPLAASPPEKKLTPAPISSVYSPSAGLSLADILGSQNGESSGTGSAGRNTPAKSSPRPAVAKPVILKKKVTPKVDPPKEEPVKAEEPVPEPKNGILEPEVLKSELPKPEASKPESASKEEKIRKEKRDHKTDKPSSHIDLLAPRANRDDAGSFLAAGERPDFKKHFNEMISKNAALNKEKRVNPRKGGRKLDLPFDKLEIKSDEPVKKFERLPPKTEKPHRKLERKERKPLEKLASPEKPEKKVDAERWDKADESERLEKAKRWEKAERLNKAKQTEKLKAESKEKVEKVEKSPSNSTKSSGKSSKKSSGKPSPAKTVAVLADTQPEKPEEVKTKRLRERKRGRRKSSGKKGSEGPEGTDKATETVTSSKPTETKTSEENPSDSKAEPSEPKLSGSKDTSDSNGKTEKTGDQSRRGRPYRGSGRGRGRAKVVPASKFQYVRKKPEEQAV